MRQHVAVVPIHPAAAGRVPAFARNFGLLIPAPAPSLAALARRFVWQTLHAPAARFFQFNNSCI